ncbi:MAG: kinase [Brevundimonas sp.]|nr:MAG: kinase [Brevundimonas sp.]
MEAGPTDRPPVIGIAGAQGSGKTTLARKAAEAFGAVQLSLDDLYLTKAERASMARDVHPLFAVRGPPGTHDLDLLDQVIEALSSASAATETMLPVFDKLADDRAPQDRWRRFRGRPAAILIDGWCLGALPPTADIPEPPPNALERREDPDGGWRASVDSFAAGAYRALAGRLDALAFLRAPGFEVVLDWRCEQEEGLRGRPLTAGERRDIADFIQHFERLTRRMIDGGVRADTVVQLDRNRLPVTIIP